VRQPEEPTPSRRRNDDTMKLINSLQRWTLDSTSSE